MSEPKNNSGLIIRQADPDRIRKKFEKLLKKEDKNELLKIAARKKREFIKKWVEASKGVPEIAAKKQAEILWDLFLRLENVEEQSNSMAIHHMRF